MWIYYVPVISLREITKRKILLVFGKSICEQINQRVGMRLLWEEIKLAAFHVGHCGAGETGREDPT